MRQMLDWLAVCSLLVIAFSAVSVTTVAAEPSQSKPVQVYILAGQSNMEGHAKVETLDYLADHEETRELLALIRDEDGGYREGDRVWISYLTGRGDNNGEGVGKLTTGFGSRSQPDQDGGKIGPELTFGLTMEQHTESPILIIKTAWGGKSLFYDFRPPSAGIYPRTQNDIDRDRNHAADLGKYYRMMVQHVKSVLDDIGRVVPSYSEDQGYELAGFVWFQGWNDVVNRDVYPVLPAGSEENRFAKYSEWMADFIRDVRSDLDADELPFVIGVMGVDGNQPSEHHQQFREAMAAPASLSEFQGNVVAVPTGPYWDEALGAIAQKYQDVRQKAYHLRKQHRDHENHDGSMDDEQQRAFIEKYEKQLITEDELARWKRGASNAGYHYLGCGKTMAQIGEAFANAMLELKNGSREGAANLSN
ncbi:sialate O-acetylesterase [Rhodopirellula halodulae]|uniref:sialate O-acetylesterase n=1 Tax=Rhodopirellula halodulae TaxID=2894198 RepID=UPI001E3C752E|nr:sialate O-acetylesterase [Rhodopirellula sp. JC737]MCC9657572.1 sialate O-acetylesterase [Rhodopirellula sp. JC737]